MLLRPRRRAGHFFHHSVLLLMTRLFHSIAGPLCTLCQVDHLGQLPSSACVSRRWRGRKASIILLGLALIAAPSAHAQSIRGLFASDVQEQGAPRDAGTPRKDWRNTLDRQGAASEQAQQRRKMSEEERSNLRQHLRDAARGAYPDDPPPRKGRR